ncbi:sodium-dependent organic anion transporter-like [Cloeon dipterum]|uniref:sodium-dependent organic anion transporter-like n=1 Tax=Cloeon dipterum TaxID=197152 RepID=UPI00321F7308
MQEIRASALAFLILFARLAAGSGMMNVVFEPSSVRQLEMMSSRSVIVWTNNHSFANQSLCAFSSVTEVADVYEQPLEFELAEDGSHSKYKSNFTIVGRFLGYSKVYLRTCAQDTRDWEDSEKMTVSVISMDNVIDSNIFIGTFAVLIIFANFNFGCALDLTVVEKALKKPIGITIGLFSQFVFMPLMSFFTARLLFPGQPALQFGLFFAGCSPGGVGSNLWTLILDGNLDLSVTMTAVSTFASFLTIPFWVFTLGHVIFADAEIGIPYKNLVLTTATLLFPLLGGVCIKCKYPKVAKFLAKTLKPLAGVTIIYTTAATFLKAFLFKLVNLRLLMACISNPILGYLFGAILSMLFRQSEKDVIAISIETGLQNLGIAILLLKTTLERPERDISEVVPLIIVIATQVPLGILFVISKIRNRNRANRIVETDASEDSFPLKKMPIIVEMQA